MIRKNIWRRRTGVSLIEVMMALIIVAILGGTFVMTWFGSRTSDDINKTTQMVYNDLILIRSKAIAANQVHRINFTSDTSWTLEKYDDGSSSWVGIGESVRNAPTGINLTAATFAAAGANLEADTSGLYVFQNGLTGEPYVTVEGSGYTYTRSINVAVGGALEFETN